MTSPTIKDSSIDHDHSSSITNQQGGGGGGGGGGHDDHGGGGGNGFGSSSSPDPAAQANETRTPTSTEVEPSQTPPPVSSPTVPPVTSSGTGGGVNCEITSPPHAMDYLHPPPPFIPLAASSNVVASSGRKRGRPSSGDGESSSSSSTPRKLSRGHDHTCAICGREFSTDKAYYGHLRKHPERPWRGAYPPQEPAKVKKLGPTLLELANQTSARMSGRGPSSNGYNYSSTRGSLGIDLNNPPPPTSADDRAPVLPFDLNMLPPPENDDEEEEEEEEDPDNGHQPNI